MGISQSVDAGGVSMKTIILAFLVACGSAMCQDSSTIYNGTVSSELVNTISFSGGSQHVSFPSGMTISNVPYGTVVTVESGVPVSGVYTYSVLFSFTCDAAFILVPMESADGGGVTVTKLQAGEPFGTDSCLRAGFSFGLSVAGAMLLLNLVSILRKPVCES